MKGPTPKVSCLKCRQAIGVYNFDRHVAACQQLTDQRKCKTCGTTKPITEFRQRRGERKQRARGKLYIRTVDVTEHECKACAHDLRRRYAKARRRAMKLRAIDFLGGKCCKCGYSRCTRALEFHHRGDKDQDIAVIITKRSWEETRIELLKCDLLCANCHREVHYPDEDGERVWFDDLSIL